MSIWNSCLAGKNKKGAKHKLKEATPPDPTKFLQNIVVDLGGKQNIQSDDGFWYPMFTVCTKTSFTWLHLLVSPTEAKTQFEDWLRTIPKQQSTHKVDSVRHDGGRADFDNKAFTTLLKKYNITDQPTGVTSTGNAKVERRIGIAKTDSLTNMAWWHGPRGWWSHSIKYSVTTRNLLPTPTNPDHMSPYEYEYVYTNASPTMAWWCHSDASLSLR